MKALFPTLAAPITNTSLPRRSLRIAPTASGTPAPVRLLTCGAGHSGSGPSVERRESVDRQRAEGREGETECVGRGMDHSSMG